MGGRRRYCISYEFEPQSPRNTHIYVCCLNIASYGRVTKAPLPLSSFAACRSIISSSNVFSLSSVP